LRIEFSEFVVIFADFRAPLAAVMEALNVGEAVEKRLS
jgi:hypothetical protein